MRKQKVMNSLEDKASHWQQCPPSQKQLTLLPSRTCRHAKSSAAFGARNLAPIYT